MTEPLEVDVLTGFLGAGKTSLVRRMIERGTLADTAILVNEFAGLPVDQQLIGLSGASTTLVGDRCLCCVTDGNLRAALEKLLEDRAAGRIPAFSRILVETSGLADPTLLIATLATDPILKPRLRIGRVVTLVDLCHGAVTLDGSAEAMAQLIAADVVLFTKADLAPPEAAGSLAARIAALNPIARIAGLADDRDPFDRSALPDQPAIGRRFLAAPVAGHDERITASILTADEPLEWARFAAWLSLLLHRHGNAILRIKGTVGIVTDGAVSGVIVQSVRHIVHRPEHLPPADGPMETALVVIGRGLAHDRLSASFRHHVVDRPTRAVAARRAVG